MAAWRKGRGVGVEGKSTSMMASEYIANKGGGSERDSGVGCKRGG